MSAYDGDKEDSVEAGQSVTPDIQNSQDPQAKGSAPPCDAPDETTAASASGGRADQSPSGSAGDQSAEICVPAADQERAVDRHLRTGAGNSEELSSRVSDLRQRLSHIERLVGVPDPGKEISQCLLEWVSDIEGIALEAKYLAEEARKLSRNSDGTGDDPERADRLVVQVWNQAGTLARLRFVKELHSDREVSDASAVPALVDRAIELHLLVRNSESMLKKVQSAPSFIASLVTNLSVDIQAIDRTEPSDCLAADELQKAMDSARVRLAEEGISFLIPELGSAVTSDMTVHEVVEHSAVDQSVVSRVVRYGVAVKGRTILKPDVDVSAAATRTAEALVSDREQPADQIDSSPSSPGEVQGQTAQKPSVQGPIAGTASHRVSDDTPLDALLSSSCDAAKTLLVGGMDFADPAVNTDLKLLKDAVTVAESGDVDDAGLGHLLEQLRRLTVEHNVAGEWQELLDQHLGDFEEWLCSVLNLERINPEPGAVFDEATMLAAEVVPTAHEGSRQRVALTVYPGYVRDGRVLVKAGLKRYE